MNCPCDELIFLPGLRIPVGVSSLPRQIATFPEFRAAMLSAIGSAPALHDWRARSSDDFGVMLLEMWAYVCDCISFYDEAVANEMYLRTAQLRPSLRKLVALLGYLPRPAVAARVDLALLAEGRQYIALPQGTAFRSGSFPGGPPQVFELDFESRVHPFTNQWAVKRIIPPTLEPGPTFLPSRSAIIVKPRSLAVKSDQLLLVADAGNPPNTRVRRVTRVEDVTLADGETYKQIVLAQPVPIPGNTPIANLRLATPAQTGKIFQRQVDSFSTGLYESAGSAFVVFDSLIRQIGLGDRLVLEKSGDFRWFTVAGLEEINVTLASPGATKISGGGTPDITVTPPAPIMQVTRVRLDASFNDSSRRENAATWQSSDAAVIKVHFDFRSAGEVTAPAAIMLAPGDPIGLTAPVEAPQDGKAPGQFLLEDKDATGAKISANINFVAGTLTPDSLLKQALVAPVTAFGNVIKASRGETVSREILGSGNASVPSQTFKLKKSPLTYFPAPTGVKSTLKIYVDGLQLEEVHSFFGVAPEAKVYIVRQNDAGESSVTFGDGIRGARLSSGSNNVIASYRFGAGKASPPAGSIQQMAKPVKGITSVRNPVAAFGGDDSEASGGLRTYAPRSALLLGRAISIPDMEAAAASVGGVRAVRAEWRWNELRQRPLVQLWYIGAPPLVDTIVEKLNGLTDSVTPIDVEQAIAVSSVLALSIEIDPKRIEAEVLANVRAALMGAEAGLLTPERIGIGLPLFRSRIFETVLSIPGALAVSGLFWNGTAFDPYGISAGAGNYFDLEQGALLLNGKAN